MKQETASQEFIRHPSGKAPVLRGFFLLLVFFLPAFASLAAATELNRTKRATLPDGRIIVVAEGADEPVNRGNYSMRLYSGKNPQFPLDDFIGGVVRPRNGAVDRIELADLDGNGDAEIIVIIRNSGSDPSLSADAFSVAETSFILFDTIQGFRANAEPRTELVQRIQSRPATGQERSNSQCRKITEYQEKELPKRNEQISISQIREICINHDMSELWAKIEQDPPRKPFQSDGCSLWFGSWQGRTLYPACFLHDLKYWAGYPGEEVERLIADAELMIDVACLLGSTTMAETMFHGTRLGGAEMYQRSFSWGFGRE